MAELQTAKCPQCSRTISPEDSFVFGDGRLGHLDCRRPRVLSAEEQTLLFSKQAELTPHQLIQRALNTILELEHRGTLEYGEALAVRSVLVVARSRLLRLTRFKRGEGLHG